MLKSAQLCRKLLQSLQNSYNCQTPKNNKNRCVALHSIPPLESFSVRKAVSAAGRKSFLYIKKRTAEAMRLSDFSERFMLQSRRFR